MSSAERFLSRTLVLAALTAVWAVAPAASQPPAEKPRYLRALDKQYAGGDWLLQCESGMDCRILGAVDVSKNREEIRPVVMIDRDGKRNASFRIQIAFIDGYGQIKHTRNRDRWPALVRSERQPPFSFEMMTSNALDAHPVAPEFAEGLVSWLTQTRIAVLDDQDGRVMRMPRGDLAGLLRRMDRLQRPTSDPLTKSERSAWLKQYHYQIKRVTRATGVEAPEKVKAGCDQRPYPRYIDALQLDAGYLFWIAHCPEGSRMFLHKTGQAPVPFDLRRFEGGIQRDVYSAFDPDSSLLTVKISEGQRGDCGHRVRFGWTGTQSFGMIEHRRMTLCRHVPADFWPIFWSPTSWRYLDGPPASAGDAAVPGAR